MENMTKEEILAKIDYLEETKLDLECEIHALDIQLSRLKKSLL